MLTVTYDNSDKDLPAICVIQVDENAKYKCLKMVIGEQAEVLYKALTDQSFQVAERIEQMNEDRVIGHWIPIDDEPHEDYECDVCGKFISTCSANIKPEEEFKYCPECGSKMK